MDAVRDPERVAAVRATGLLDTGPEEPFDRLTALAAALLDAPYAFLTLVDDRRAFRKSSLGVDAAGGLRELAVNESFCRHVVGRDEPLLVTDTRADGGAPLAADPPGVVAWAGHPIRSSGGHVLGTLCVADTIAREWTSRQATILAALAGAASSEVGLRSALAAGEADGRRVARLARVTAELSEALTPDDVVAIALRETSSVLDGDGALLCVLWDGELQLAASQGIDPDLADAFRHVPVERPARADALPRRGGGDLALRCGHLAARVPERGAGLRRSRPRRGDRAAGRPPGNARGRHGRLRGRARRPGAGAGARGHPRAPVRPGARAGPALRRRDVGARAGGAAPAHDGRPVRDPRSGGRGPPDRLRGDGRAGRHRGRPHPQGERRRPCAGGDRLPLGRVSPGELQPLDAPLPLVEVLRTGEPFWFESADDWPEGFPPESVGLASSVAVGLPLSANGALTGAVAFRFSEDERAFSPEEREHGLALAAQCSSALERARLHDAEARARHAAERAEDRARLLADVSLALDAPVGVSRRFDALVRAVVPRLADFCTVRALDDRGNVPLVACAHADADKQELVRATYGSDRSLGVRGGPAQVIRSGRAVLISEVTEDQWEEMPADEEFLAGLRELAPVSYIGVPMTARGRAIGALALMCGESGRRFTEEHRDLAVEIGRRAGLALDNAILYEGQRHVAETLQEALLPFRLPQLEGGELARRYVASEEPGRVGGDWYDAIPLTDGRVLVAVGDVVGRGPQAAAVMGQLRSALGIFAAEDPAPAAVLDRLAGFALGLPDAMGTTAALCLLDLGSGELSYACAGHPPPLVVPAAGAAEAAFLWEGRSPPLGLATHGSRGGATTALAGGDTLLLYTDGLVERPRESIDESLERLRRAALTAEAPTPDALCDALLASLAAGGSGDDTALLALRLAPAPAPALEVAVPAVATELGGLRRRLSGWLQDVGAASAVDEVILAAGEAAANCVEHAYRGRVRGRIALTARIDAARLVAVEVRDTGRWRSSPAPGDRGRGLGMMRATMDEVGVRTDAAGTVVRMTKRLDARAAAGGAAAGGAEPDARAAIELSREGGAPGATRAVARLEGEIDHASAPALLARLVEELAPGDELTVDLREVPFLDSAGTRLVGELIERVGAGSVRLAVRRGSAAHRAIELSGLARAPGVALDPQG